MLDIMIIALFVVFLSIAGARALARPQPPGGREKGRIRRICKRLALVVAVASIVLASVLVLDQPVAPRSAEDRIHDTIYLGWPTEAAVGAIRRAYTAGARPLVIVDGKAIREVEIWAKGMIEVEALTSEAADGLTLSAAIQDLTHRRDVLDGTGLVIFAYPRTADPAADVALLRPLLAQREDLRSRLRTAWPTSDPDAPQLAQQLPGVPEPLLNVPAQVSEGQRTVYAEVGIHAPPGVPIQIDFQSIWSGDREFTSYKIDPATGTAVPAASGYASLRLSGKSIRFGAELDSPPVNEQLLTVVPVKDSFGNGLVTAFGYTAVETPDIGVVLPKGRKSEDSPLLQLLYRLAVELAALVAVTASRGLRLKCASRLRRGTRRDFTCSSMTSK